MKKEGGDKKNEAAPKVGLRDELSILPLRNTVIYPGVMIPLTIGRESSLRLIQEAMEAEKVIGIVGQRDPDVDDPDGSELFNVGTVAVLLRVVEAGENSRNLIAHVQGMKRVRIMRYTKRRPYLRAEIQQIEEPAERDQDDRTSFYRLKELALRMIELSAHIPQEVASVVKAMESISALSDLLAAYLNLSMAEKEELLETLEPQVRLEKVLGYVRKELQMLELNHRIQSQVKGELDKSQREYYLRKQLGAIKKELGEDQDELEELEELRLRVKDAQMPPAIEKEALKELNRLSRIPVQSAEYTVSRTYLDWMVELPWSGGTEDHLDIQAARLSLNEDHFGLEKVKKRILEYLAVRKLKADMKGPILCFVGPPGVGKTSLGKSIARAMQRKYVRVALGGVKDEAEIRGHRRTYIGALPGRIIQSMKKAGCHNPVFLLDEIDKLSSGFRGDPASALLEVLDPEQNDSFSDHYLGVPYDLSKVSFIATANQLEPIPPALRDRMEILEVPGYTEEEKAAIAKDFLIERQHEEHGLEPGHITFHKEAVQHIIRAYTREAGVRHLEREIASVCRSVAMDVAEGQTQQRELRQADVASFLGPEKFVSDLAERVSETGVATGLAWTPAGGQLLFIEVTSMAGKGQLILTGQLGDVMKESAQAALSYVKTHIRTFKADEDFFTNADLHIHVPAGAVPKDGPSAGVALFTALVSLLTGRKARSDVAMTGEISLRGMILPVGGIKEKVLAAHRAGVKEVLLPQRNKKDMEEIPEEIKASLRFHWLAHLDEVPTLALEGLDSIEGAFASIESSDTFPVVIHTKRDKKNLSHKSSTGKSS